MSEFFNDSSELIEEIAKLIAQKVSLTTGEIASETITEYTYPRHPQIILLRKVISLIASILLVYASINIFHNLGFISLQFTLSLATIITGLTLTVLLVLEVFRGAGMDLEITIKRGEVTVKEYHFVPSLNRLSLVFLFLGLGFLGIILGFASLYTDLWRENPANFAGVQDGILAIYFSIVTFSTVGYGDVYPVSLMARTGAICEIFMAMFFSLVAISTTLSWSMAHRRQQQEMSVQQRIRDRQQKKDYPNSSP